MRISPSSKPKLKVKVQFYHLIALTFVVLLCFYLMYRDIKRIEGNCFKLFKRVDEIENLFKELKDKIEENLEIENNNFNVNEELSQPLNIENIQNILNNISDDNDVNNVDNNLDNDVDKVEDKEENRVDNNEENQVDDNEDIEVEELLKNISVIDNSNDDELEDLSKLTEDELKKLSNDKLKDYLKSINKPITGNKTKLINLILEKNDN
jgi:hypothetical protein